ncbi:MAG: DNA polymerase III subunit alpha [Myxococcota bacterium]
MASPPYAELGIRSAFSFLEGASTPEDLVERAAELGHGVLALCDVGGVYGAPRFWRAARRAGVRPRVGARLTLLGSGRARRKSDPPPAGGRVQLLVHDARGYRNLCRLITRGHASFPKPHCRITLDDLRAHRAGLTALVREPRLATTLAEIFPGELYAELRRHADPDQERRNRALLATGLPPVATGDVRHARASGKPLLDALTCLRHRTTLEQAGRRLLPNGERHLRSPREMAERFGDCPEALRNTLAIAERCQFTLGDLGYRFPDFPLAPGETPAARLRALVERGARDRYAGRLGARVRRQLDHELAMIRRLDLEGYFLIVWDIVRECRARGILAQGRGSAANSLVCYALGITAIDPIRYQLLFERFLSEERGEWPDIDIDLPSGDRREEILQYVYARYGPHGAAMTANVISYRPRSAVRELGKVLGLAPAQIDRLARLLSRHEYTDESDTLEEQIRRQGIDARAPRIRHLLRLVRQIQHLPRHLSQHSGGMVIARGRLDHVVPLEPARMADRTVVQWDKDDCADLGIIKIDLLGLGMMAVLEEVIPLVREHDGVDLDLARLPPDDPETYAMLQRADTVGVFQVESRAQMATLPRMKPRCFYDLVVEVAIIRPGPIVGHMVQPYLLRRAGRQPVTFAHPDLEPILARTLGVPLFQEQLLRIAMAIAGFSGGEAEELRRAMGFKRSAERMRSIEERLRAGMTRHGIEPAAQNEIIQQITSFALYGFPESHAASFALLAYASAYIRAHHPACYLTAMLNAYPLGFYSPATLIQDAQRHGVPILPIDIQKSSWPCTIEPRTPTPTPPGPTPKRKARAASPTPAHPNLPRKREARAARQSRAKPGRPASPADTRVRPAADTRVRLGLRYVDGLRRDAAERIAAAAPFHSLADLARRTGLHRDEIERLGEIGACAALGLKRREALWQIAALEGDLLAGAPSQTPSPLVEMSPLEETLADYRGTGLTIGPHLMTHLRDRLRARGILSARELRSAPDGHPVRIAGVVIVRQRPGTARGFLFLTLEDETGTANAIVVPDLFQRHRALLQTAGILMVEGRVQSQDGVIHVRARRFECLDAEIRRAELPPSHDFR